MNPSARKNAEARYGGPQAAAKGRFISGPDLMKLRNKNRPYVIDGVLPVGATLCAGPPKSGKTFLGLQAALAVATGNEFLGQKALGSDVLYLDLDNADRAEAASRLAAMSGGEALPETFTYNADCGREELENLVRAWRDVSALNPGLVVIDLFENIRPRSDGKGGRAFTEDYDPAKRLNALALELGVAMLALVHTNKSEISVKGNPFNSISATNGLFGGVAGGMILDAGPMDKTGMLHIASRGATALSIPIVRQANGVWRRATTEERMTLRLSGNGRKIVQAIARAGTPMRVAEIATATGIAEETVKTTLKRLAKKGAVSRAGRGEWEHRS